MTPSNQDFEAMGRHMWALRATGHTYPLPVLAISARKAKDLTQDDLAKILGSHRSTIAKIEGGYLPLNEVMLHKWADACDVDHDLLVFDLVED